MTIVFDVEKHHSLYGRDKVTVDTDHEPFEAFFRKTLSPAPSRLQRMLLRLQKYSLEVRYKKGQDMYIANAQR